MLFCGANEEHVLKLSQENHGSNQRLHRLEERVDQILDALK